jgi:hypothetical protein
VTLSIFGAFRRYRPNTVLKIDFRPFHVTDFATTLPCEEQQPKDVTKWIALGFGYL